MSQRELDVLNILWATDKPMTATDIVNKRPDLTQSTVIAVLRKLLKFEFVEVAGVEHSGKVLSRTYNPTEKSRVAIMQHFMELYKCFSNVISPDSMIEEISKLSTK